MVVNHALDAYRQVEKQASIHPVKLIHMMYERVLTHLEYAEAAIREGSPRKRGENLGRAIALVTELNAAIKPEDESEAAEFLRGLYSAMLVELPKVSISNDPMVLRRAAGYIRELKKIWEETALVESGLAGGQQRPAAVAADEAMPAEEKMKPGPAASVAVSGVSVSI
ncbi:MAG: flagellar export chaperone FliS [Thermodesulfobacteriota bacterium]